MNKAIKHYLLISILSLSSFAFADTVSQTISEIEENKNARCELVKQGTEFCINFYCRRTDQFSCESNQGDFGVKLKVRTMLNGLGQIDQKVRRVIYLK